MKRLLFISLITGSFINAASENTHIKNDQAKPKQIIQKQPKKQSKNNVNFKDESAASIALKHENTRKIAQNLVKQGIDFLSKNSLERTCYEFTHTNQFLRGELSLFLLDKDGNYIATADESFILWKNIKNVSDNSSLTIEIILNAIKSGNPWINYAWRNATRIIYVEQIEKDNRQFFIGTGYYSFSQEDAVVNLVKQAVEDFNEKKALGRPIEDAFSDMSYPRGKFANGNLYLFAYDFDGDVFAHGNDPTSVGTNALDEKDVNGRFIHREIIEKLKTVSTDVGIWIEHIDRRALKKSYCEKVQDARGKNYFIGCGYYPDTNRKEVTTLVDRGYELLKTAGLTQACNDISTEKNDNFRFGDLYLFIYDMQGLCLANGEDQNFINKNFYHTKDEQGNYYVQNILKRATITGAWVSVPMFNSVESVYVRKVDLGSGQYVIGSGIFPASKEEAMILLTKSAISLLETYDLITVFSTISQHNNRFIKGDLETFIFDDKGFCLAYGDNTDAIWQNFMNSKDDNGKLFIKTFINAAITGPSTIKYRLNNAIKEAYVESVKKNNKTYIIGSSRYLH